ncbi:MAG: ABC transporter ATP-binding protein, partial [Chloroflexi bacterium]|nr:ABC transporter ATP-binding protein [Chloroflexota bacterium]
MPPVLTIDDVSIEYNTREGPVRAVRGASLTLERGEIVALVGESGSGKTTLGLGILRILPRNADQTSGTIRYEHRDIGEMDRHELQRIRGDQISMIFQDPIAGLNPIITVGQQVEEVITSHRTVSKVEARERSIEALNAMRLPDPLRVAKSFPGELSGGMCQRIMIAIATALDPQVLIADEPTASLDVTVQAQILYELERLRDERGTAILLITHDMGVVAQIAERVAIIYAGKVME